MPHHPSICPDANDKIHNAPSAFPSIFPIEQNNS